MMRIVTTALCALLIACTSETPQDPAPSPASDDGGDGGTGGTSNQGGNTAGGAGGTTTPPSGVPMFVAVGEVGRTVVSCDDGLTWIGDRAWDTEGHAMMCGQQQQAECYNATCSYSVDNQCVQKECCNHTPGNSKGVAFGSDTFVATWGWGAPGAVMRSPDGFDWETTLPNDSFGGIAYGNGRFVVASRTPYWSTDGIIWNASEEADFRNADGSTMWSVRRFHHADYQGGSRFVAAASGNSDRDLLISSDGGQSWWRPSVIPDDCAHGVGAYGDIVSGNDIIVIVGDQGVACRSTDGGDTWSTTPTGATWVGSAGVWTGSEFAFWADDNFMVTSPDGETWTMNAMATPTRLGPVARSADGTFVGLGSVWTGYDQQAFMRSSDGLTWEALPDAAFPKSHPIFYIEFGYGDPSQCSNGSP